MEKQQEQRIYSFPQDEVRPAPVPQREISEKDWFTITTRSLGMFLLISGFLVGIKVMLEAQQLYSNPIKVEQLALSIEKGSNLDSNLNSGNEDDKKNGIQLTYFVAWIIALFLLVLVSTIAFSAMRTGGELVLQGKQNKKLINQLAREVKGRRKTRITDN